MDKLLQNVGDLPTPARSAVEALMGHALRDDQQLYIVALDAAEAPAAADRQAAWSELEAIIADAHGQVRQSGLSPAELEQTVDEACRQTRYGA